MIGGLEDLLQVTVFFGQLDISLAVGDHLGVGDERGYLFKTAVKRASI